VGQVWQPELEVGHPNHHACARIDDSVRRDARKGKVLTEKPTEVPQLGYNPILAIEKMLLNGGGGAFTFGPGYANSMEWALPACKTIGILTLDNIGLNVDPANYFTWYDHHF
jgi:hypothetical protein